MSDAARDPKKLADLKEREEKLTKEIDEGKTRLGQAKETSKEDIDRWLEDRAGMDVDKIPAEKRKKLEAVRLEELNAEGEGGHKLQIQGSLGKDQVEIIQEERDFGRRQEVRSAKTLQQMSKMWGLDEPGSEESDFEKEVGEFLDAPKLESKLDADTLKDYREEIFTTPEAISALTGGTAASRKEMFTELDEQGVGRSELLAGLDVAKLAAEQELANVRTATRDEDVTEKDFKKQQKKQETEVLDRLGEIAKARGNVHEGFGSTEGGGMIGMMRDLMEKLDEFIGNRKPLDVRVVNP